MRHQRKNKLIFGLIVLNMALLIMMVSHREPDMVSNEEIKAIRRERDSVININRMKEDTLCIILESLEKSHRETQAAHNETQKAKSGYEKIKFVSLPNDSVRNAVLSELYPSSSIF